MADSAIDKLKGKPTDQRVAIAEGVAITVIIILLAGWAILFFRKIQNGQQSVSLDAGAQNDFNFTNVKEAQQQLQNTFKNANHDLRELSDPSNGGATMQMQNVETGGSEDNAFTGKAVDY